MCDKIADRFDIELIGPHWSIVGIVNGKPHCSAFKFNTPQQAREFADELNARKHAHLGIEAGLL